MLLLFAERSCSMSITISDTLTGTQLYMPFDFSHSSSIDMGNYCANAVAKGITQFDFAPGADENHIVRTVLLACVEAAKAQGVSFNVSEYVHSIYPQVKVSNELTQLFDMFLTDKGSYCHNFGQFYHQHLDKYRTRAGLNYLELGSLDGASLRTFREYFPLAGRLVGVDISPRVWFENPTLDIHCEVGSQSDVNFLTGVHSRQGPFDVVIDDASHVFAHTVRSFEILFPLLRDGGVYIVEDTHIVGPAIYDYFSALSQRVFMSSRNASGGDNCCDPWKLHNRTQNLIERSVREVSLVPGAIIVYKEVKEQWAQVD